MTIPKHILAMGAPVVYGWLTYHANKASELAATNVHGKFPWTYPTGCGPAVVHPRVISLKKLASRLYAKRSRMQHLLEMHGRQYTEWNGV